MKAQLFVEIEISEDAAALLNAADVTMVSLVQSALSNVAGFRSVTVDWAEVADDEEDAESDGEEIESAPADRDTPKGRTGLTDRQVASAYRKGIPVVHNDAPKGGASGRTGRPATLHNLRAADGEPVRASGPRSREALENQGIAVWDVEKGETGPTVKPKNTGERARPVRASGPAVMKTRNR